MLSTARSKATVNTNICAEIKNNIMSLDKFKKCIDLVNFPIILSNPRVTGDTKAIFCLNKMPKVDRISKQSITPAKQGRVCVDSLSIP